MSTFLFVFRALVGSLRLRGALLLLATGILMISVLGAFSTLFLLEAPPPAGTTSGSEGELIAYLDAMLPTLDIEHLYVDLRNDPRIARVSYVLPQQLTRRDVSGAFIVATSTQPDTNAVADDLAANPSIARVDRTAVHSGALAALPGSLRTGLLLGLLVGIALCLAVARFGLGDALRSFDGQLRILHLAGADPWTYYAPILALGIGCGVLASAAFIAILYPMHMAALSDVESPLGYAQGLLDPARVQLVAVLTALIGISLGSLVGALGVGLAARRNA